MTNFYQSLAKQNFPLNPLNIAILAVSALFCQTGFAESTDNFTKKMNKDLEINQQIFDMDNYIYQVINEHIDEKSTDEQDNDTKINRQIINHTLTDYDNFDQAVATFENNNTFNQIIEKDTNLDKPLPKDTLTPEKQDNNQQAIVNQDMDKTDNINPDDYLPAYQQNDEQTEKPNENSTVVADKTGIFGKLKNKILNTIEGADYIEVTIVNADEKLQPAKNIKSALEQVTVDSVEDFNSSINRLRQIALDASKAVGYYDTQVSFKHLGGDDIEVSLVIGEPVQVQNRLVDVRGEGAEGENALPVFTKIEDNGLPHINNVFNHREYEETKALVDNASATYGFFDGKWLNKSVDVILPDNVADVDLVYDTNQRYQFGDIKVYSIDKQGNLTDDPDKLPIKPELLNKLLTYQKGDPFYQPLITDLNNQLSSTRYFNGLNVDVVLPDNNNGNIDSQNIDENTENNTQNTTLPNNSVQNPDDYAPIDFKVDDNTQQRLASIKAKAGVLLQAPEDIELAPEEKNTSKNPLVILANVISDVAKKIDKNSDDDNEKVRQAVAQEPITKLTPEQVANEKAVPTYIVLDATKPHEAEIGLGYETDVGVRAVAKLSNHLVNRHGHQAGISVSASDIDRAVEITGSMPYKHPNNDKLTGSLGYQYKKSDKLANTFEVETIYANIARNVRRDTGWNRTTSIRYRADELQLADGRYDTTTLPYPFNNYASDFTQESLLLGYAIHKTKADNPINPSYGYSQRYSVEVGSDKLLTDSNLAIFKAGATGLYSFGAEKKHQVLGRLDLGYIYSNNFFEVPYRLRFFAGGDQSIRGFNTDTLSPSYGEQSFLTGGDALAVGSLEYNYEFREGLRLAMFGDVGGAYDTTGQSDNKTNLGLGLGLRWASPMGLVRLDIASGVSEKDDPVRIHFFIGSPL